jgi:hypothetical protein
MPAPGTAHCTSAPCDQRPAPRRRGHSGRQRSRLRQFHRQPDRRQRCALVASVLSASRPIKNAQAILLSARRRRLALGAPITGAERFSSALAARAFVVAALRQSWVAPWCAGMDRARRLKNVPFALGHPPARVWTGLGWLSAPGLWIGRYSGSRCGGDEAFSVAVGRTTVSSEAAWSREQRTGRDFL